MVIELTDELLIVAGGACALGIIVAAIVANIGLRRRADKQDPRDSRIRSLEAELRVAHAESEDIRTETERLQDELKETSVGLEKRDVVISEQQSKLEETKAELKSSVMKTHQLRTELADRATQGLQAAAKIREVETELSVAQASNDMIATGVLDYEISPKRRSTDEYSRAEDLIPERELKKSS